jgi:hypothetical protein
VRNGRYFVFQLAEVAVPRVLFAEILRRIDGLERAGQQPRPLGRHMLPRPETQPGEPGTTFSCRDDLLRGLKERMMADVAPISGASRMQ